MVGLACLTGIQPLHFSPRIGKQKQRREDRLGGGMLGKQCSIHAALRAKITGAQAEQFQVSGGVFERRWNDDGGLERYKKTINISK